MHETPECHHIVRLAKEQEFRTNISQGPSKPNNAHTKQARLVLGAQPPAPGTVGLRYADPKETQPGLELVSAQPYYIEKKYQVLEQTTEYWDS